MNGAKTSPRQPRRPGGIRQLATFGVIGTASTLAYVAIYAWLRAAMPAEAANALALLATAVANTAANRRLTFAVRGRQNLARDHAAGLIALGVALLLTSSSIALMDVLVPHRGRALEIGVLVGANVAATLVRFLLLRLAIDRPKWSLPAMSAFVTLYPMKRTH
jgi:putative flippase GtrA